MALVKPALAAASLGQPVTAQAWNEHVAAILELYDFLLAIDDGTTLRVAVTHDGQPVRDALVVASNGTDAVQAVAPIGGTDDYLLGGLTTGDWTLRVRAPGLTSKEPTVTMPHAGTVTVALESDGSVLMPDVFGAPAKTAFVDLKAVGIELDDVFDTAGQEVTKTSLTGPNSDARVLFQLPAAGSRKDPSTDRARLVIGVEIVQQELVAIPDLTGETLSQAKLILEKAGLELGHVGFLK